MQCYNRTLAGILFMTQGTGVAESLNALYRKNVADKEMPLPHILETVGPRIRKRVRKDDEHDVTISRNATIELENTPFFSSLADAEKFWDTLTAYAVRRLRKKVLKHYEIIA